MRGSNHVAGDQQACFRAVQAHVLGRVAVAGDAVPGLASDVDRVAVHDPPEALRHGGHHARVVARTAADLAERFLVQQAVAGEEGRGRFAAHALRAAAGDACHVEVRGAHPQPAAPPLRQPGGQAHVVRMEVRDDQAQHRQAAQVAGKDLLPVRLRRLVADAAVDDRPALAAVDLIAQQPEVDVVEREGQAHADPEHARRELQHAGGFRQGVAQGIAEFGFAEIGMAVLL